ncbi:MAG: transglutaminase family protein [Spirochaetaceae bacterium]|nr:transglutaminase family protein [Spirochaetaceae bacterium]
MKRNFLRNSKTSPKTWLAAAPLRDFRAYDRRNRVAVSPAAAVGFAATTCCGAPVCGTKKPVCKAQKIGAESAVLPHKKTAPNFLASCAARCALIIIFLVTLPLEAQNALNGAIQILENFESNEIMSGNKRFGGNAVIVSAKDEIKEKDFDNFGNSGRFVKLDAAQKGTVNLEFKQNIDVKEKSIFSFRYCAEIAKQAGQTFSIFLDELEKPLPAAAPGAGWLTERLTLGAGSHSLRFEAKNLRGAKIQQGYNAVYIDDIYVFPDKIVSVSLEPRGEQYTYLGAGENEKLRFIAKALFPDGSPKSDAGAFSFSATGGSINSDGVWTPDSEGAFSVTAALGNFTIASGQLVVYGADIKKQPVRYAGTGKTYMGFTGGERAKKAPEMPSRETLIITNPKVADFEADAFFLLEGAVRKPSGRNFARVLVRKLNATPAKETFYIVEGAFSRRIWLPFGAGEYQIELIEFDRVTVTSPPKGEGVFRGGAYSQQPLVFTVRNTREEPEIEGGQHWLYPSFNVQSDDFRIINLLNHITFGISGERAKIEAVHDYIVTHLKYDTFSFSNPMRARKMDAISVIKNEGGVCEGYAWLSAALLRAAGIPCRLVANRSIMHLWNNVWTGGAWKFYDATWDDPVPDGGPFALRRTYFLLDSLSGGDARHRGTGTIIQGDVE